MSKDGVITTGMRKSVLLMVLLLFIVSPFQYAKSAEHPILYLFWGEGCPHCEDEKEFLEVVKKEYPQLEMRWFEVWNHPEFAKLADAMRKAYKIKTTSVPMTFLGEWSHVGFLSFETTGVEMTKQIENCLQQGCHDALDKLSHQDIVSRIREEVMQNTPNGWELHPTQSVEEESSKNKISPSIEQEEKVVVYYFHGTYRCPSCTTIEQYTEEALYEAFTTELNTGAIEWKSLNVESSENQHFIRDYQLYTKSVIVSGVVQGKEQRWKNLQKVWELLRNEKAFKEYVKTEVKAYLEKKQS